MHGHGKLVKTATSFLKIYKHIMRRPIRTFFFYLSEITVIFIKNTESKYNTYEEQSGML